MVATIAAIVVEIAHGTGPGWLPLGLPGARRSRRSGWRERGPCRAPCGWAAGATRPPCRATLARRVLAEHIFCFAAIACLIGVQLGWG